MFLYIHLYFLLGKEKLNIKIVSSIRQSAFQSRYEKWFLVYGFV